MSLSNLYRWFDRRCRSYDMRVADLYKNRTSYSAIEFRALSETLLSDIWQTWCSFSRILILRSVRGTIALDSSIVSGRRGDNSWRRICYEGSNAARNRRITSSGHNRFLIRNEITWGDVGQFISAVQYLAPANSMRLLTAYGLPFDGIKHMQKVRNACAHKNVETLGDIQFLKMTYDLSSIKCPTHVMWSNKRGAGELAIELWIRQIATIAKHATLSS